MPRTVSTQYLLPDCLWHNFRRMHHEILLTISANPTHSSHTTGTHGTANPLDRNNDGTMNARDLTGGGQHAGTGLGHNTASHGTSNPLDRNNDGTMNARDLTGSGQHAGTGLGHNTASHGTANPLDRNNDGRMNASDLTGSGHHGHGTTSHATQGGALTGALNGPLDSTGPHNTRTANILDPHVSSTGHSGTTGGIGHNTASHGTHGTSNPLDRNNDGRVNAGDLTGNTHSSTGAYGHSGTTGGIGHNTASHGTHGTHGTANPLDRNNDGRMNAGDLTGNTHSSTGAYGHTANPVDRNNDGRVDARDLTGAGHAGTAGGLGGAGGLSSHAGTGHAGAGGLEHRQGETGALPQALTEDVSRAENHGQAGHGHNTTGVAGTHQKPSLMDKLNPKKDADGDGKAGFMK
jgi:hypothetical protein